MTNDKHPKLIADALLADPRVAQAKQLLLDAVVQYQKQISGIRPPNPELTEKYHELLEQFAEYRGSKLWFPYLGSGIGNGPLVELADGSIKYDFISGIGPHYFGHSHLDLISSSIDAAISDTIMQGHLQQNRDSVNLCRLLLHASEMDHCFLTTSGAMANENALKIAFQKRSPANRILAFEKGFAGRTLVLSQITDKPAFRDGLPSQVFVDYIPFYDAACPEESTHKAVHALRQHLVHHPKEYAAMLFELVQGEGGCYPGTKEFFSQLMHVLKEHEVVIIADEIQTFGRTPSLFAFQHFHLMEFVDIVTIGKISQVCATLFKKELKPRLGLLSQTFTGSTSAIRASEVTINNLLNGNYFGVEGKNTKVFELFKKRLHRLSEKHLGCISGPYGIGAMIAFTPFDGNAQRTTQFVHALFDAGVMSFIAGSHPTRVRLLVPAGSVTESDIDKVVDIIESVLIKEKDKPC